MRTILHAALQVVSDCNTLLTPFLPHAAQQVHELLGGTGVLGARCRRSARSPRTWAAARLPGADGRLPTQAPWESQPLRGRHARCSRRRRCSASWTSRSSTRSWPASRRRGSRPMPEGAYPDPPEPLAADAVDSHCHLDLGDGARGDAGAEGLVGRRCGGRGRARSGSPASCRSAATCRAPTGRSTVARRAPVGGRRHRAAPQRGPAHRGRRRATCPRGRLGRDRPAGRRRAGARDRRDRARLLPDRSRRPRRAGGVLPPAHRPGQGARQGPGHPRPGRPRRRAAGAGGRGRARARRLPLLLRRPRHGAALRRARVRAVLRRAR